MDEGCPANGVFGEKSVGGEFDRSTGRHKLGAREGRNSLNVQRKGVTAESPGTAIRGRYSEGRFRRGARHILMEQQRPGL